MLSDAHRRLLHDFALSSRALLTQEARDVLQSAYALSAGGQPGAMPPTTAADPDAAAVYRRLKAWLDDEVRAGLPRAEAMDKLVKEIAFTHLNRLAAFKMMEARGLIRGTVDRGTDSNGFKIWLVDHPAELAAYERGAIDATYRRFLLWQAGQVARELAVLFDPDAVAGLVFPRPHKLGEFLKQLNDPALAPAWQADEAIGWLYQFFNEEEKAQVFDRLYKQKQKIQRADIPAATQLFTPEWIVRFLVQNTLGRLWVEMHPDSRLVGTELVDYLVSPAPLLPFSPAGKKGGKGEREPARSIADITLLDPASGTMHFGLVAFDLFAAMYAEEIERAGEPGWPAAPPVGDPGDIPAAILAHNLHGIDIDLRATQLSALALWLRAKRMNPRAELRAINLACADVRPLNGERLGAFLKEMQFSPLTARLIRELWDGLRDADQVGSLLRLERSLGEAIVRARREYEKSPLLARMEAGYGSGAESDGDFWGTLAAQVEQGLDEFARTHGFEAQFFAGEAHKGIRLLGLLQRYYDVVVTNPPYSGKSNLNGTLAAYLDKHYPASKEDLYTAFIQRCAELAGERGWVGMITQQSFMFLSSFEALRVELRERFAIESMAHVGARAFAEVGGEKVNTTVFTLRAEPDPVAREASVGTYYRLVKAPEADGKHLAFEAALAKGAESAITYHVAQSKFDAIPGAPWTYWISDSIRSLFEKLPSLGSYDQPREGINTGKNERFVRYFWEVDELRLQDKRYVPFAKGAPTGKYYDQSDEILRFDLGQIELLSGAALRNIDFAFKEGLAFVSNATSGFRARLIPPGFMFCSTGGRAVFPKRLPLLETLGLLNSSLIRYFLNLINPTVTFTVGNISSIPIPLSLDSPGIASFTYSAIRRNQVLMFGDEVVSAFCLPKAFNDAVESSLTSIDTIDRRIDNEVYRLYNISDEDRATIEAELNGSVESTTDDEPHTTTKDDVTSIVNHQSSIDYQEKLAVPWISYAVGVVLGRFSPGTPGALGRAVYRCDDFAVGSLPAPDEAEFDQLVGPAASFAYIDEESGRHVFSHETEAALRSLALPDGIAVLDPGHPRDLPALVERALDLMLGPAAAEEVVATGAGGDLRRFLSKDYFTRYHFSRYRNRPVYWPVQSAGRAYGFVVFHEKIGRDFLYVLLSDYLTQKQRALATAIEDARGRVASATGAARRAAEREQASLNEQLVEVSDFARTIKRLADGGYRPAENWIDDGVILRLAPIHELIPLWKAEPKKHWDRLQRGDFDWSHIAMHYWPERVKEKCRTNKSFAIAHGM